MKRGFLFLATILFVVFVQAQTERRVALVVGNSDYVKSNYLKNPVNDADSIAKKLKSLGFDVIMLKDADLRGMDSLISVFGREAAKSDVALFYYSGHGIQAKGENYLVPVDANLVSEADVRYKCTSLGLLLDKLDESGCPMKIVVLDACRDNPFTKSWHRGPGQQGLQSVNPPKGTFITFSTAPGSVAQDGTGMNSPYTTAFLAALDKPNLSLYEFFEDVGHYVLRATHDEQDPWTNHSSMRGASFYFNRVENTSPSSNISANATVSVVPAGQDLEFTVRGVTFKMIYVEGGTFTMGCTPEQGNNCYDDEKPTRQVSVKGFYMGETEVTQALWKAVMLIDPRGYKNDDLPVNVVSWNDCNRFVSELTQLTGRTFRLPTEEEWEYAARGGKYHSKNKYVGSNNLSDVAWFWQNSGDKNLIGVDNTWDEDKTEKYNCRVHPVKSKLPNALGLFDMSGNVWEWCADIYQDIQNFEQHNPYSDLTNVVIGIAGQRGGSCLAEPYECRVSYRFTYRPECNDFDVCREDFGLRIVLEIP